MLQAIGVLIRARLMVLRNSVWRGKLSRKLGLVAIAVFLLGLVYGVYSLTNIIVAGITSPEFENILRRAAQEQPAAGIPTDFRPYLEALPSIVLFGALVMMVLTSFSTVLSSLYLSGDIDMLLVAPVPMRAVFVVKFFGGLLVPYVLLFAVLAPALVGYGQGLGFGPAFYLAVLVVLALLPLLPFSIGALLVMAVVRVIPARRAREIVGVLGGLVGIGWFIFAQFSRSITPRVATVQTLDSLRNLNVPLLPSAWAGRALLAAGAGEWLTLLVYGGLFVVVSLGVFGGALLLAERLYYAGWSNMATQGGKVRRRASEQARGEGEAEPRSLVLRVLSIGLPPESAAILYKDLRVFPRDLRNLQQLIFPLVLAGVWIFQLISNSQSFMDEAPSDIGRAFSLLAPAGIAFFICLSLSTALGGPTISREGRGMWLLKVAPITAMRLLLGKFVLAYLPFPLLGTVFVLLIAVLQRNTPLATLSALGLVWVAGLGVSAITLGIGAAFPRLDWEKPTQQSSVRAGCLTPLAYLLYLGLGTAGVVGAPFLGTFAPELTTLFALAGWLFLLTLTAGVVWFFLGFGARRLERLELA